jgi:hypothetical protein
VQRENEERVGGSGREDEAGAESPSAAQLFDTLWVELVTVLGSTAAATLVRRAGKRACQRNTELCDLSVAREGWEYRYRLPAGWEDRRPGEVPALADLVRTELVPLLRQFTGEIVLRRLSRVPHLAKLGFPGEDPT